MIRKIIFLLLCIVPSILNAQVTISAQLPPAGMVQKDQLWNLILVNNKEDILDVNIKMNLQDASTGLILMSANSGNFLLGKGVKVITSRDAEPILYNYNTQDLGRGYLPMGTYVICYQLYRRVGELQDALGDECIRINIDPLSPPLLNTPADKTTIETPYPQFTWMPPTPVDMFSNLSYDLLVTEVGEGQSAVEAMEYNTPIYSRNNLQQNTDNYPSGFKALEADKTYAWQVIAKNGLNYAAKTEVWTFKLKKKESPVDIVALTPFVQLKTINPDKGIAPNGILKIAYNNKTADKKVRIEISEVGETDAKRSVGFDADLIQGENNIQYDLKKIMNLKEDKVYIARLVNTFNEVWFIRFVIKNYK